MKYEQIVRPVWAEIDLGAVRHNLSEVRRLVGPSVEIMAIVKADAYGHGAIPVAETVLKNGASCLGVALPEEGLALRQAGITAPILVLGIFQPEQAEVFVAQKITATIATVEGAAALAQAAKEIGEIATVQLKVDTGMGRIGVSWQDALALAQAVSNLPGLVVEGIYSHLATAYDRDKGFARKQIQRFNGVLTQLKAAGLLPEKIHLANSAAVIDLPEAYYNLVRPGIILYGLKPDPEMCIEDKIDLKPVLSLKTKVSYVKRVASETGIGYGQCFHTNKETTIVTLPIGYADGWSRLLAGKAGVLINGKRYPVVGNICMDQCMVDVGDDWVERGTEVTLIGKNGSMEINADEVGEQLGTINYEVVCRLGERIPRMYKEA